MIKYLEFFLMSGGLLRLSIHTFTEVIEARCYHRYETIIA